MKDVVKRNIIGELKKETIWYKRIIITIFSNVFYGVYRKGMIDCFKYYNK